MSRLDSVIRRLTAQRECLNSAFKLIRNLEGPIVELGLGNGRTYDHIREHAGSRRIVVFERSPHPHPDCWPPERDIVIGNLSDTLPLSQDKVGEPAALLHSDIGCGDPAIDAANAALVAKWLPSLVAPGGIVLSDQPLSCDGFISRPLPAGVAADRYTFLQRSNQVGG